MRAPQRIASALAVLTLTITACTAPVTPPPPGPTPSVSNPQGPARVPARLTDVNCDGVVDVVFASVTATAAEGVPWRAGSVTVRYGGSELVQVIDQRALGDQRGEAAGRFGGSVATGGLNLDRCPYVVVGDAEAVSGSAVPSWRCGVHARGSARIGPPACCPGRSPGSAISSPSSRCLRRCSWLAATRGHACTR